MKRTALILYIISLCLFSCQNKSKTQEKELKKEEKLEMDKIESMQKTNKEKEDSVKAYWEKKMNETEVGAE